MAGESQPFDDAWTRRQTLAFGDTQLVLLSLADLILTKPWAMRAKNVADIQLLEALRRQGS